VARSGCIQVRILFHDVRLLMNIMLTNLDEEYELYARHDKPAETLESDAKLQAGENPTMSAESPANK